MRFGVVVFPGSNCDHDMLHVLGEVMGQEVTALWHKDSLPGNLGKDDCVVLPGGFSYGDYLRSGAIARFSPIMEAVIDFANKGGYVWGICNGFQILCEAGLLPGALLRNRDQRFICKNVFIKVQTTDTLLTYGVDPAQPLQVPIAHAEGRYYTDAETLEKLGKEDRILFRYCEENGDVTEAANPNSSLENIAGVCNVARNVFGMMPHPERAAEAVLGNTDGKPIFESLLSMASAGG